MEQLKTDSRNFWKLENSRLKAERDRLKADLVKVADDFATYVRETEAEVERLKQSRPEGHAMNLSERLAAVEVEVPEVEAVTGDNHIWAWGNEGRNYEALYAALAALVGVIERQARVLDNFASLEGDYSEMRAEVERLQRKLYEEEQRTLYYVGSLALWTEGLTKQFSERMDRARSEFNEEAHRDGA